MSNYSELYLGDELTKLRDGLEVIERVIPGERIKELELWLYGIVTDESILAAAKETIVANSEESLDDDGNQTIDESDVELTEIAIAIPINSPDVIDMLHSRGIPVRDLDFAYQGGQDGVRTHHFFSVYSQSAKVRIDDLKEQAIAESDLELDDYLKQKGKGFKMQIKRKVERTEEATEHPHPANKEPNLPEPPSPPEPASQTEQRVTPAIPPKKTSLKISKIVEDFLGG